MTVEEVLDALGATTPEALLRDYQAGRRNFPRINLLRAELRSAVRLGTRPDCLDDPSVDRWNPLWLDHLVRDFEWDSHGRCVSADFDEALPFTCLAGSTLTDINLAGSYLYPASFAAADLSRADFRRAILIECDLSRATLFKADFRGALLRRCSFGGADLSRSRFERATFEFCDLHECNLSRTVFSLARFRGVDLRGSDITSARCVSVTLAGGVTITTDQLDSLLTTLGIVVVAGV